GDVLRANNTWSASWEPRLRIEMFPSARVESAFTYYTGRRRRTIACRPTPSGVRLQVEDLEARAGLQVGCPRPRALIHSGAGLEEGRGYAYDPTRRMLTVPLSGAATIDVQGASAGARSLSVF